MKKMFSVVSLVCFMGLLLFGCDEGMSMVKPIVPGEAEVPTEPEETQPPVETPETPGETQPTEEPDDPITTIGEMKEEESEEPATPTTDEPEETQEPEEMEEPAPEPMVTEISCYSDEDCTIPLTGSVGVGVPIYTKVVFSGPVQVVIPMPTLGLWDKRPDIYSEIGRSRFPYGIKSRGAELQSGEVKPYRDTENTFVCKYVTQVRDRGETFLTYHRGDTLTHDPLHIIFFTYMPPDDSSEYEQIVRQSPNDFIGTVLIPGEQTPAHDVTLTIVGGTRAGESTTTNQHGQYVFRNVAENQLHLQVEKMHFEPKEVIVYRDSQTILANGDRPDFPGRSKEPGTIHVGLRWPDQIRFIFKRVTLSPDVLYYEATLETASGIYAPELGLIVIDSNSPAAKRRHGLLRLFAHELAHAWQGTQINNRIWEASWQDSPSGKAFAEAQEKDWEQKGEVRYYDSPTSHYRTNLRENAAEISALFWSIDTTWETPEARDLEIYAPNRLAWCREWLK